jgi:hypothetical protein
MYSSRRVVYPRSRKKKEKRMKKFILILSIAVSVFATVDVVNAGSILTPRQEKNRLLLISRGELLSYKRI